MIFFVDSLDLETVLRSIDASSSPTLRRVLVPGSVRVAEPINTRCFRQVNRDYLWLFAFLSEVEQELAPYRSQIQRILNSNAIVVLLENSFCWGNQRNPRRPLLVEFYVGNKGVLVRIEDDGQGFDVCRVMSKYSQHDFGDCGEFEHTGYGLRILSQSDFEITYEGEGKVVYLLDRLKKNGGPLPSPQAQQTIRRVENTP